MYRIYTWDIMWDEQNSRVIFLPSVNSVDLAAALPKKVPSVGARQTWQVASP